MRNYLVIYLLSLTMLTACAEISIKPTNFDKEQLHPLPTVELLNPSTKLSFPDTGKTYAYESSFPSPKTIDCRGLSLKPESFENAIEAGALQVRVQTPGKVKIEMEKQDFGQVIDIFTQSRVGQVNDKEQPHYQTVKIKKTYGGVLALCNVSEKAKGPDSRSYRIRGLDEYLAKGKDGHVSVVGAVLSDGFSRSYSWMLWLSDRSATFTDYQAMVQGRKASSQQP